MKATRKNLIDTNRIADTYALPVPEGHELIVSVPKGTRVEFRPVPTPMTPRARAVWPAPSRLDPAPAAE